MSEQLNNCKGQRIYFIFNKNIPPEVFGPITGIWKEQLGGLVAATLIDYDELGIWVKNTNVEIQDVKTEKINKYDCNVLIKWEYILSIVRMPDREVPVIEKEIGFKQHTKESSKKDSIVIDESLKDSVL